MTRLRLFIAANNQLQSPSAEDDVLSSAGRDQTAADEDEREEHQDEIERVHRQRTIMLRPLWSDKRIQMGSDCIGRMVMRPSGLEIANQSHMKIFKSLLRGVRTKPRAGFCFAPFLPRTRRRNVRQTSVFQSEQYSFSKGDWRSKLFAQS
jgi:hypothetical protein